MTGRDLKTHTPDPPKWQDPSLTYSERVCSLLGDVQHWRVGTMPATQVVMAMMDEAVEEAIREATEPRIQIIH